MKSFAEKIKSLVSSQKPETLIKAIPLDFVKSKKGMLRELILSKECGNAIGIYSKALGHGMFLVSVLGVVTTSTDSRVILNRYDMSGSMLSRYELNIEEIQMVCPLNIRYKNPPSAYGPPASMTESNSSID